MANLSEQISELSAELLLKAIGELSQLGYQTARIVGDVGKDAGIITRSLLIKLINNLKKDDYDAVTRKAISKIEEAALNSNSPVRQATVLTQDLDDIEQWLKKQDVLYVAIASKEQDVPAGAEKSMIMFLEKDYQEINNALSLVYAEKGLTNEVLPQAFLLKYDKKDVSVIDGVDLYELEVFRQTAKQLGLVYSVMANGVDEQTGEVYGERTDTFKILCSNQDVEKLSAAMQQVAWSMTGEYANGIKEKVKERYLIKTEIEKLIKSGVKEGHETFLNKDKEKVSAEIAKYIVNAKLPGQYIKMTGKGFFSFNRGENLGFVSKDDPEYLDKLDALLSEFSDAVIIDSKEWETERLEQSNFRKNKVRERISVIPPQCDMKKETESLRKAHKKRQINREPLEETAWLFHRFDAEKAFSEVVQLNYNDVTEPLEETISVHYGEAVEHSKKYRYFDVVNDEKTIDNIIRSANERSLGASEAEYTEEKEID